VNDYLRINEPALLWTVKNQFKRLRDYKLRKDFDSRD